MTARLLAALCAALAAGLALAALRESQLRSARWAHTGLAAQRWSALIRELFDDGGTGAFLGRRRQLLAALGAGAGIGWSLLGTVGVPVGALTAPLLVRWLLKQRQRRYTARIDAGAAEFALALASALSAGRSVRGALLVAPATTPQPLARELDRVAVDLAMGRSTLDALAALRSRTGSARIEGLVGAIALQRGSGGDLVRLTRELAEAFRERDRALRDARSASAQARFTAVVVAAIPLVLALVLELASPGAVSGALRFAPTALMLALAAGLLAGGVLLSRRMAAVGQ